MKQTIFLILTLGLTITVSAQVISTSNSGNTINPIVAIQGNIHYKEDISQKKPLQTTLPFAPNNGINYITPQQSLTGTAEFQVGPYVLGQHGIYFVEFMTAQIDCAYGITSTIAGNINMDLIKDGAKFKSHVCDKDNNCHDYQVTCSEHATVTDGTPSINLTLKELD